MTASAKQRQEKAALKENGSSTPRFFINRCKDENYDSHLLFTLMSAH